MDLISVDNTRIDDVTLIRLLAQHDSDALNDLYDRYGRLVYSIAFNIVGDQEDAEEIVQDVFTRVWEKAYTYDSGIARVSTWLINITRNRAIDQIRRSNGRLEKASIGWGEVSPGNIPYSPGLEEEAEHSLQKELVSEALGALSHEEREVLAYAYFKGYSHSKIAESLGIPLGTVKTRIRLAMNKLRLALSSELIDQF